MSTDIGFKVGVQSSHSLLWLFLKIWLRLEAGNAGWMWSSNYLEQESHMVMQYFGNPDSPGFAERSSTYCLYFVGCFLLSFVLVPNRTRTFDASFGCLYLMARSPGGSSSSLLNYLKKEEEKPYMSIVREFLLNIDFVQLVLP